MFWNNVLNARISKTCKTHRFPAGAGGKHLSDAGGSTHDSRAVGEHENQLLYISRAECPVLTSGQRHQLHSFHHLSYKTKAHLKKMWTLKQHRCLYSFKIRTVLVNVKLKAILSENIDVFNQNTLVDGGEVKLLGAANTKDAECEI